jgi:hypothetical protein
VPLLECHEASKYHLFKFGFFLLDRLTLISYWGKTCYCARHTFLLGFPTGWSSCPHQGPFSTGLRYEPVLKVRCNFWSKLWKNLNLFFRILEFLNFRIFELLLNSLISNHFYSYVKVYTRGPISRSVTHPHTAPSLARLTFFIPSLLACKTALATSW